MMSSAMRQLEERHMASKIELMVWSNKMDLLALSNVKGEVTLHRLSWQRVWTLSPPGEDISVNGIAWRPDGQVIAIGYSNGIVLIVDVENKDIVHKNNYSSSDNESCSISSICWLEEKSSLTGTNCSNLIQENSSDFLPRLPPISRTFGSINEESNENLEDTKKVSCQKELNFLIVGFTSGKLYISVFGLFECGIIHLPDDLKSSAIPVAVEISADLKNIFVLVSNGTYLKLIVYDSYVLNSYCKEIYALAYKHGQIMSLMDYLDNTMHAVCEAYENILLLDMESKLSRYAESMPEGTVSADFLELLMFGHMTDSLESFLLHDLTDKGIKKLRHSIELSHSNIQKLVLKHVQAVGQSIAFHLSELKGMARYTERFQVLGVDEPMVTKSFSEVGSFLVKANEVLLVIDESMKKYKALFKWLYDVILRISDDRMPDMQVPGINEQDTRFIADYLYNLEGYNAKSSKKHCFLDHLGQYINDEELTHTLSPELNLWEVFLKDNPCIAANPAIIPRHEKLSLTQQHNRLKQVLKDAFSNPQKAIGSKISVASVTHLMGVSCLPKVSITHLFEKDKLILVFLPHLNTTSYVYMDIVIQEGNIFKSSIYFKSQDVSTGYTVVDLQIYNKDTISVLLQQPGESRNSVFVQMSMRKIQESTTPADGVDNFVDGITLVEPGALRVIENMVACKLAVSGTRRVAVMLSENMHKVRTYEMEVEEDEEEEDMETTRESDSSSLHQSVVAINDPKWPNALLVDEGKLGDIINSLNSYKEANNSDWAYEYVKTHCKAIIAKDGDGPNSNLQMMPYNDLLITENDDRNKAYSCCLECSLGFIDYSKQPDNNFKYVLVYQDDATKFTFLKPLKEKEKDEISRCLLEIFSLIGVPGKINTREKSLVKSVFNKDVGNFCQNFSTKIRQSKNGFFEEEELCRIDKDIKEWMKSAMSRKWSQGLCFVQFRNNCNFNEAINAAPFYALLKPSYTYSRRKYTRYLYRKKDNDETPCPIFLKNPICNSNREIVGTSQMLEMCCKQEMKDQLYPSLKEQDNKEKNSNGPSEMVRLKFIDNRYERDTLGNDSERAYGNQMDTLNQHRSCAKHLEKVCGNKTEKKYEMEQRIHDLLKNEDKECKRNSENKLYNSNNILNEELSKEDKHVTLLRRMPQSGILKNEYIAKTETEIFNKNKSNQESSLIKYLDNHCGTVNMHDEPMKCCKKRKYEEGNDRLNMPESSLYHVLSLVHDPKNDVATSSHGTKQKLGENVLQIGKDLNKKGGVHGNEKACPTKIENKIPFKDENINAQSKVTSVNSSNIGGFEISGSIQPNLNKKQLNSKENNSKANSVRSAHECRGKEVCSNCKKKKKHKAGLNSLNRTSLAIGSTVKVRVPVTERLKGYPNYILATIVEEKDKMYKVATPKGVLKELFKGDQLFPCNTPVGTGGLKSIKATETGRALTSKAKRPFR